ncbi:restin homolog [Boleophthalmus pectinirostris]|uniref:restin homolog n=1 Tax=Boleophthalmus pectinirostris TaxID=150288 RepID=UPI00242E66E5|nr:restin homolog [Boleophthalmus pectinirostris]
MDIEEENMTAQEMMEKIAQLDHSRSILKDQNTEMRSWLDAADEDMSILRAENSFLKKQVKDLEKIVSDAQSIESEPTKCQPDNLDLKIENEIKIQNLERESVSLKEENKKLRTEIKNLQQLQEQDDVSLNKLKVFLQALESENEVAQLGLQQRDEVIQQKHQELKHAEEMVEEYSTIIKDLRLKNQQLKDELEAGQDEVLLALAIDLLDAKDKSSSPALSFAEEMRLLDSSVHTNISTSDVTQANGEVMSEKVQKETGLMTYSYNESVNEKNLSNTSTLTLCKEELKPQDIPNADSSKHSKCVGILMTVTQKVLLFLGTMFLFFALASVTPGSFTVNSRAFSLNTMWSSTRFLLEPYCTVHYGGMPPI